MRFLSFLICLVFIFVNLFAQSRKLDLLNTLLTKTNNDTLKMSLMLDAAKTIRNINPDSLINICNNIIKLAEQKIQQNSSNENIKKEINNKIGLAYLNIGIVHLLLGDFVSSEKFSVKSFSYLKNTSNIKGLSFALNNIGNANLYQGKYNVALKNYFASINYLKLLKDKQGEADAYSNVGLVYDYQGNYPLALKYHFNSLQLREQLNDKPGVATCYNNIGIVYQNQQSYNEAIAYYKKSLKIREELKDQSNIATSLNNIGIIFQIKEDYEEALKYYKRSSAILDSLGDEYTLATITNNIGNIYDYRKDFNKAWTSYNSALELYKKVNDQYGIATSHINIGKLLLYNGKLKQSKEYLLKGLEIAKQIGNISDVTEAYSGLSSVDTALGNFKEAYSHYKKYYLYRDSLNNEDNTKKSTQIQMQYEFDKKEAAIKAEQDKKDAIALEEKQKQRIILISVALGLLLVIMFSFFLYRRFKLTQKQKAIIEEQKEEVEKQRELADSRRIIAEEQKEIIETQKHLVEEKQKEVLDSIHYASRIQRAMLTSEEYISSVIAAPEPQSSLHNVIARSSQGDEAISTSTNEIASGATHLRNDEQGRDYFILYKPKDIVAGDFYWAQHHHNLFYLCTADCTGHGVPGAFMSLLNIGFLNENVIERGIKMPHEILEAQRKEIIKALNPKGNEDSKEGLPSETASAVQDGMDCVLAAYDFENMKLYFAAANNPLVILRPTRHSGLDPESNSTKTDSGLRRNDDQQNSQSSNFLNLPNFQILEYKAQKMPIGRSLREHEPFELQTVELQKGDLVYTWSDGYPDQFGLNGKKFMSKNLKNLLLEIAHLPLSEQKQILDERIEAHKGGVEQTDDILLIGVKV